MKTYRHLFSLVLSLAVCLTGWAIPVDAAKRALLIGVENYKDSRHDLEGVREDVKIMKEVLLGRAGFNESEIKILVDQQATKEDVVKNFKEWLINGTKRGTRLCSTSAATGYKSGTKMAMRFRMVRTRR